MFSRLYLEITTCCNRACSFCPGTARPAAFVTPETFRTLAAKLRPYGQYLYLHVMGEPLLHPQLPELLEICRALDFRVTLTTNGTLLPARQPVLLAAPALRKVSVSLHSFEANEAGDFRAYLTGCTDFARAAMAAGVLTDFRLWNLDGAQTKGLHDRNDEILAHLHAAFSEPWQRNTWGWRLAKGVFVSFGERFDWPDAQAADRGALGCCRALSGLGAEHGGRIMSDSSAFSDGRRYFLVLSGTISCREYLDGISSRRIEAVIGEFGRNTDSLHAEAYICEHCSCVCETSAVRILSDM